MASLPPEGILVLAIIMGLLAAVSLTLLSAAVKKLGSFLTTTKDGIRWSGFLIIGLIIGVCLTIFHDKIARVIPGISLEDVDNLALSILIFGVLLLGGVFYVFYRRWQDRIHWAGGKVKHQWDRYKPGEKKATRRTRRTKNIGDSNELPLSIRLAMLGVVLIVGFLFLAVLGFI